MQQKKASRTGGLERIKVVYFFFFGATPRIVALGTEACFMKADGLIPTMCLNCFEKW